MIELDKIYNEDCLEGMKRIPDGMVDCIITDLPYGVLNEQSEGGSWDSIIPLEPMWEQFKRVTKPNAAVLPRHVHGKVDDESAEVMAV